LFPEIPRDFLSSAVELAEARERGKKKFARVAEMFFTREALEQATDEEVAKHRAERFCGLGTVCDACCGIGGDAIALGSAVKTIICVDKDPARLLFCEENARLHGVHARMVEGDILELPGVLNECDALFIDPSRRPGGRRTLDPFAMEPPLDRVVELMKKVPAGAVKLPPSIREENVNIAHELEWVSTSEGLKEAVLWTGNLGRCKVSVSLLDRNAFLCDSDLPEEEAEIGEAGDYLYEPDPALIRSGLLGRKAACLGMKLLSREIAYTISERIIRDDFFHGYRVLKQMKFNLKRLSGELNALDIGRVTVKKRGFPLLPEEVISKLRLKGSGHAVVILTRLGKGHEAFIVEQIYED
ncbi:MAG: class I SAM-dependent methyltransferase, partial [Candidatus Latescibacterota bacterium]